MEKQRLANRNRRSTLTEILSSEKKYELLFKKKYKRVNDLITEKLKAYLESEDVISVPGQNMCIEICLNSKADLTIAPYLIIPILQLLLTYFVPLNSPNSVTRTWNRLILFILTIIIELNLLTFNYGLFNSIQKLISLKKKIKQTIVTMINQRMKSQYNEIQEVPAVNVHKEGNITNVINLGLIANSIYDNYQK